MSSVKGKGCIWPEYWIDCCGCDHHQPLSTSRNPAKAAREQKWRRRKSDNKWLCPACVEDALEVQQVIAATAHGAT